MKNHPRTSFTGPELCSLDPVQVVKLLKIKEISPQELLESSFERINQVEPSVNAIPTLANPCQAISHNISNNPTIQKNIPASFISLITRHQLLNLASISSS